MLAVIEEYHVTVRVPGKLPHPQCVAIKRVLNSRTFQGELRAAVLAVVKEQPQLAGVRVTISR